MDNSIYDEFCKRINDQLNEKKLYSIYGRVLKVSGTIIKAAISEPKIGQLYQLKNSDDGASVEAEVIGIDGDIALLTPLGDIRGISSRTKVISLNNAQEIAVSDSLLGKVIDSMGNILNKSKSHKVSNQEFYPIYNSPPEALSRISISKPLALGVKALDGFVTCAEGQRLGIYAAAGMGKSTLLAMLARNADVDVIVLVLIGERGREVREFIEKQLKPADIQKSVIVVATSDKPAMQRVRAAYVGTAVAEYFRDKGKRVLLLMDSVTRFARAQREIGLACGEIPTRRGYPSSVFSMLPQLFERAGNNHCGSITAIYTVLVEGDDFNEPVSDETRSLLDGHIILSSRLAQAGHFPAIDVPKSLSRIMDHIVTQEHIKLASKIRELIVKYEEIEFLVRMGEYEKGSDPLTDTALDKHNAINAFLRQSVNEPVSIEETLNQMRNIINQ